MCSSEYMMDTYIESLLDEWELDPPLFIQEDVFSTSWYPLLEDEFGDDGSVIEYEDGGDVRLVVVVDNAVRAVVGLEMTREQLAFAKAVVLYVDNDIDTAHIDGLLARLL